MRAARVVGNITQVVEPTDIPNGTYGGFWGGYVVRFFVGDKTYKADTDIGIRTPSAPVVVVVNHGVITIEIVKERQAA